jgi:hypothetical protein
MTRTFADQRCLRRVNARNYTSAGSFRKTDRNLCQVVRILSFGKNDFRHAAPHVPAEIKAGKVTDPLEPEPLNRLSCSLEGDLPVPVPGKKIL